MWTTAPRVRAVDVLMLVALIENGLAIAGQSWQAPALGKKGPIPWYKQSSIQTTAVLASLVALSEPDLYGRAAPQTAQLMASIANPSLNARDDAVRHKGYYEKLDKVNRLSTQLWEAAVAEKPADWVGLSETPAYRSRNDFLGGELVPSTSVVYLRKSLHTNRWGMRDKDYELTKAPGTYRIAILGASHVMGSAVADGEPFESVLEDELNRTATDSTHQRYEILNFGVPSYSLVQQMALLEDRVFRFSPDMVIITAEPRLDQPVADYLANVVSEGVKVPFEGLESIL